MVQSRHSCIGTYVKLPFLWHLNTIMLICHDQCSLLCQVGFSPSASTLHHHLGKLFILLPSCRKENSELQWESPPDCVGDFWHWGDYCYWISFQILLRNIFLSFCPQCKQNSRLWSHLLNSLLSTTLNLTLLCPSLLHSLSTKPCKADWVSCTTLNGEGFNNIVRWIDLMQQNTPSE